MKMLINYITEKLKITKDTKTLFPKTKEELKEMIESEIEKNGNKCSLNHIDVSEIKDMSKLFYMSEFDGDISKWDVSNVIDMESMFHRSKFTGENSDISNWNVSKVTDMSGMFWRSSFNSDISNWNVSNVENMSYMFAYNNFNGDLSNWDVPYRTATYKIFDNCPLQNNPPKWYRK